MQRFFVDATYENGVLKLEQPLPVEEGERVRVTAERCLIWRGRDDWALGVGYTEGSGGGLYVRPLEIFLERFSKVPL